MLSKLLKYEFRTTGRTLLPIYLGAIVLSLLSALAHLISNTMQSLADSSLFLIFSIPLELATALSLVIIFVACLFVLLQRFYRLLGDQGYLMLSLPASPTEHIAAKLITACCWSMVTLLVSILCGAMLNADMSSISFSWPRLGGTVGLHTVCVGLIVALFLLSLLCGFYLFFYLCFAIGGQWAQQSLLASIVCYFVLNFVLQILSVLLLVLFGFALSSNTDLVLQLAQSLKYMNTSVATYLVAVALLLASVIWDAILWAVTQFFITKRLNLA